jgi:thiol-disulfide isomerase/thioredoxin
LVHFLLYSRSYCHLCDDMLHALQAWQERYAFTVEVIDVDADEELIARYDELVPVLVGSKNGGEPVEICHYFLDHEKLQAFLAS